MDDVDRVGGEAGLTRIFDDLLTRMRADFVVGYLFVGTDHARIVRHEVEHAVAVLRGGGGASGYTGRPLPQVHRPLRINRGHFRRRMAFLRTVLADHGVPDDIAERWLAVDGRLEGALTDGIDCGPNR
jgi:truncated hemoglobin YjbI